MSSLGSFPPELPRSTKFEAGDNSRDPIRKSCKIGIITKGFQCVFRPTPDPIGFLLSNGRERPEAVGLSIKGISAPRSSLIEKSSPEGNIVLVGVIVVDILKRLLFRNTIRGRLESPTSTRDQLSVSRTSDARGSLSNELKRPESVGLSIKKISAAGSRLIERISLEWGSLKVTIVLVALIVGGILMFSGIGNEDYTPKRGLADRITNW